MNLKYFLPVLMLAVLATACRKDTDDPGKQGDAACTIHTIWQLNADEEPLDSHEGEELEGVLEPVYQYRQIVPSRTLNVTLPKYARVKRLSDGTYMMIYHESGSNVLVARSTDLVNWGDVERIFVMQTAYTLDGTDKRKYTSPDMTVLSNGDILAYCSFHLNKGYKTTPEMNGIMMRRSKDNGKTWGEEQRIYQGTTWEPYILELPGGELNCYFTDTDPVKRNSGTSMVVSSDMGETWTPTGTGNCYKVIRQYKYDNTGTRIYTDQMPVVRMLNDGHTLLGFMEARIEEGNTNSGKSYYFMSLVYGRDQWTHLEGDEVGPEERKSNLCFGGSGYVAQFRSGETLISCARSNYLNIKLGTNDGRNFRGDEYDWNSNSSWYTPFGNDPGNTDTQRNMGISGALEVIGTHELLTTQHTNQGGVLLCKFYLNHRIDAPSQKTTIDGNGQEWKNTQALFLGSESETQTAIRAAHDSENLFILLERTDRYVNSADKIELYVQGADLASLGASSLKLTVAPEAEIVAERYSGEAWSSAQVSGLKCKTTVVGTVDDGRSDTGYLTEIAIPLSAVSAMGDKVAIDAVMYDTKSLKDTTVSDTFTDADTTKPSTWMKIAIK